MGGISILRTKRIYARIGVGKTKFFEDYVQHPGGEEYVPGTQVRRLRLVNLGERALGGFEDEVDELIEALRRERDAQHAAAVPVPPEQKRLRGRPRKAASTEAIETA